MPDDTDGEPTVQFRSPAAAAGQSPGAGLSAAGGLSGAAGQYSGTGTRPLGGVPAQAGYPGAMRGPVWTPDWEIPPGGLDAWGSPDPRRPVVAHVADGLPVQVAERLGPWARVICSNGWIGWVDGRQLVPLGAVGNSTAVLPLSSAAGAGAAVVARRTGWFGPRLMVAVVGAALAIIGGVLAWLTVAGVSITAWNPALSVLFLYTHHARITGLRTGYLLLLSLLVFVPLLVLRPPPRTLLVLLALIVGSAAVATVVLDRQVVPHPGLGVGLFVSFAGALLLLVAAFLPAGSARRRPAYY